MRAFHRTGEEAFSTSKHATRTFIHTYIRTYIYDIMRNTRARTFNLLHVRACAYGRFLLCARSRAHTSVAADFKFRQIPRCSRENSRFTRATTKADTAVNYLTNWQPFWSATFLHATTWTLSRNSLVIYNVRGIICANLCIMVQKKIPL